MQLLVSNGHFHHLYVDFWVAPQYIKVAFKLLSTTSDITSDNHLALRVWNDSMMCALLPSHVEETGQ